MTAVAPKKTRHPPLIRSFNVIASEAKQSSFLFSSRRKLDCFASLAKTAS
jgi:hypothetical protein